MKKEENWIKSPLGFILLAVFATFLWGSAVPCIKIGYRIFDIASNDTGGQMLFAGYRFFVAGIAIVAIMSIKEKKVILPERNQWKSLILLGFVQTFLQYFFYYIGMANVTGVKGSIMNSSSTLFCVLLAHFYYKNDTLSIRKVIGCLIGFGGVVLVNLTKGTVVGGFSFIGEGFILCTAMVVAVGTLINKEISKRVNPVIAAGYQLWIGGAGLILLGYLLGGNINHGSGRGILLFVYMVFISAVAFSIWSVLLKYHSMGKVSVYKFLIPVFGMLLSVVLLGEVALDWKTFMALVCVCFGIYFVNR